MQVVDLSGEASATRCFFIYVLEARHTHAHTRARALPQAHTHTHARTHARTQTQTQTQTQTDTHTHARARARLQDDPVDADLVGHVEERHGPVDAAVLPAHTRRKIKYYSM